MFAGTTPDRHLSQLSTYWRHARGLCGLEDVRIHDLRHSFASRALALGETLTMIGRLLGHTDVGSTAPLRSSRSGRGEGRGSQGGRQHRGRHPADGERRAESQGVTGGFVERERRHGEAAIPVAVEPRCRPAACRGQGRHLLGSGSSGLRGEGVSLGSPGLSGAGPRARRVEADCGRPARGNLRRRGTAAGGDVADPHQGGGGAGASVGHGSRADGGRTRGKISPGACGGAVQAEHGQGISPGDRQVHFAHAWQAADSRARARTCCRPAPPSTHDARRGERGGRRSVAHFQSGGSVGVGPGGWQPLPLRDQVQVAPA